MSIDEFITKEYRDKITDKPIKNPLCSIIDLIDKPIKNPLCSIIKLIKILFKILKFIKLILCSTDKYKNYQKKIALILHRKSEQCDKKIKESAPHSTNKRMSDYNNKVEYIRNIPYN